MKEWVQLLIVAIQSLSRVADNPSLGGHKGANLERVRELLGLLSLILEEGTDQVEDLKEFTKTVELMAREERGPTNKELRNLETRKRVAHERLQAIKKALEEAEKKKQPDKKKPASK